MRQTIIDKTKLLINRNQIVFTVFRLILNKTEFRLVPNLCTDMREAKARLEKTTTIRRTAVRETGVKRHHRGPTKGPLKALEHHRRMVIAYLKAYLPSLEHDTVGYSQIS